MEKKLSYQENCDLLFRTLQEYLDAVPRQNMPNAPDLLAIFARLDAFEGETGSEFPAQLRHYLHQKSYRKAYLYLQERENDDFKGACGR